MVSLKAPPDEHIVMSSGRLSSGRLSPGRLSSGRLSSGRLSKLLADSRTKSGVHTLGTKSISTCAGVNGIHYNSKLDQAVEGKMNSCLKVQIKIWQNSFSSFSKPILET